MFGYTSGTEIEVITVNDYKEAIAARRRATVDDGMIAATWHDLGLCIISANGLRGLRLTVYTTAEDRARRLKLIRGAFSEDSSVTIKIKRVKKAKKEVAHS